MTRSRSINRYHRFVARKRRRGLRAALPHLSPDGAQSPDSVDVTSRLQARAASEDLRLELASLDEAV